MLSLDDHDKFARTSGRFDGDKTMHGKHPVLDTRALFQPQQQDVRQLSFVVLALRTLDRDPQSFREFFLNVDNDLSLFQSSN